MRFLVEKLDAGTSAPPPEASGGSRMRFLVEKLDAGTSASTRESSGGSAMVITPRGTLSLPRTLPSPNMCLVTNVTDDPAGSMAYRPAGGACIAVLRVDMNSGSFRVGSEA